MTQQPPASDIEVRPLSPSDLDGVVAIDRKHSGVSRRTFYEKRLQAAIRSPKDFIYIGVWEADALAGFALARVLGGEYGREDEPCRTPGCGTPMGLGTGTWFCAPTGT